MDDFYDWMPFILLCVPGTTSAFLTMLKVTGAPISIDIM